MSRLRGTGLSRPGGAGLEEAGGVHFSVLRERDRDGVCGRHHPSRVPSVVSPVTLGASPVGRGVPPLVQRAPRSHASPEAGCFRRPPIFFPPSSWPRAMFNFF